MKKKLLSILVAAMTVLMFTGCGSAIDTVADVTIGDNKEDAGASADNPQKPEETKETDNAEKPVNVTLTPLTCITPEVNFRIGRDEKVLTIAKSDADRKLTLNMQVYDFDNKPVASKELSYSYDNNWSYSTFVESDASILVIIDGEILEFYDWNLNQVAQLYADLPFLDYDYYVAEQLDDKNIYRIYEKGTDKTAQYVDLSSKVLSSSYPEQKDAEFDTTKWSYYTKSDNTDYFFVSTADGEKWGFVDKDGNELAMYMDASDFSPSGFAMVSNDRKSYDIIDKNMNVRVENVIAGKSAYLIGDYFIVTGEDDSKTVCYVSQ